MSKRRVEALPAHVVQGEGRRDGLEKANEDLRSAQAELQRRWQYLADAQRLSHSGTHPSEGFVDAAVMFAAL